VLTHRRQIIGALAKAATVIQASADERDPEARKNAVIGLVGAVQTAGVAGCFGEEKKSGGGGEGEEEEKEVMGLNREQFGVVFDALVKCCDDYATDSRGDVGSWVREAAMKGLAAVKPKALDPQNLKSRTESRT
jgi:hypothetical protein